MDFLIGRLCTSGMCTLRELNDWVYTWEEFWQMHDMLDLREWLDWQHHVEAENNVNRR